MSWNPAVVRDKLKVVEQYVNQHYYQLDPSAKEDLYQAGCIGLLEGLSKFNPSKSKNIDSWLYFYIKHRIQDYTANYIVRETAVAKYMQDRSQGHYKLEREESFDLREAIRGLDPTDQHLLDLYYFQGYNISEVSKLTGLSRSTCSRRISDAEEELKATMTGSPVKKRKKRRCRRKQSIIQSKSKRSPWS